MKKIPIIIFIQLIIIGFIGFKIYLKAPLVLGKSTIIPLKKNQLEFTPSVFKFFYEPKPSQHIEVQTLWTPFKARYVINVDSLHDRFNYQTEKPPKTYRIVTLGDSFTYGMFVYTEDNWTEKLEDTLNELKCNNIDNFEVINLAVGGYDIEYAVERFKIRGKKYNPDLILWLLKDDDMNFINELMMEDEEYYANELHRTNKYDELVNQGINYPSWKYAYEDMLKEIGSEAIRNRQKNAMAKLFSLYEGKLIFATFKNDRRELENFLSEFSDNKNRIIFDGIRDIYKEETLFFGHDGHPSIQGHAAIAEDMFNFLKQNNSFTCL